MTLYAQETFINRSKGRQYGSSDVYETSSDTHGQLYRAMRKEHGRCISRVYIDKPGGGKQAIGWVFVKRAKYDDSEDTYLREVWVTVHEREPEEKKTVFYADIEK